MGTFKPTVYDQKSKRSKEQFSIIIINDLFSHSISFKISSVCSLLSFPTDRPFLTFDSLPMFLAISRSEVLGGWQSCYSEYHPWTSRPAIAWNLLEVQNLRHIPDLWIWIEINKVPRWFLCTLKSEKHWSLTLVKTLWRDTIIHSVCVNKLFIGNNKMEWNQAIPLYSGSYNIIFQIRATSFPQLK